MKNTLLALVVIAALPWILGAVSSVGGVKKPAPNPVPWLGDPVEEGMIYRIGKTVTFKRSPSDCGLNGTDCEFLIVPTSDSAALGCSSSTSWADEPSAQMGEAPYCYYSKVARPIGGGGVGKGTPPVLIYNDITPPSPAEWDLEPITFPTGDVALFPVRAEEVGDHVSWPIEYRYVCQSGSCSTSNWYEYDDLPFTVSVGGAGTHCYTTEVRDGAGNGAASEQKCVTTS